MECWWDFDMPGVGILFGLRQHGDSMTRDIKSRDWTSIGRIWQCLVLYLFVLEKLLVLLDINSVVEAL